ncbi:MAG: 1-acyl-sn-glycerol-3-phosphate acyltransferase [Ruminococcus sp.]|nr:1-acyl-sn-glycerol-3-phosphate acyltransferase [Ruminococcus sp.]
MTQKKNEKWIKKRHKTVTELLRKVIGPYTVWKYGIDVVKFDRQEERPYLILMNHQTGFDQFFVGMAFDCPIYYLATEDIFSMGWVSSVIRYLVEPIPIKKQTTDLQAIRNCIKVAKEGGTIAIAPEGNRTFDGRTVYINPSIATLAKKLNMPIAIFRIEDGYGVQPRWSDVVRKGKMKAYVSRVIEPEEYKEMAKEELADLITKELYVNEASVSGTFRHKKSAEYLERVVYVCPECGLTTFESRNDVITCKKCGCTIQYLPTKELKGVDSEFPFRFVAEWYDYQKAFVNRLDTEEYKELPLYEEKVSLYEVIINKNKNLIQKDMDVALYGDKMILLGQKEFVFSFDDVSVITVLGKNKLNIYHDQNVYQLKGDKRFNALKYMNIFYRHKNIIGGNENGEFLGL